jgi:dolichol-phosphate mannosyltransferase
MARQSDELEFFVSTSQSESIAVVVPAFNEGKNIAKVLEDWSATLSNLELDYRYIVVDAGSTDETHSLLNGLSASVPINLEICPGLPHGPSLVKGYKEALNLGVEWIFQVDSDDAFSTDPFVEMWAQRQNFDLLIGVRTDRKTNSIRQSVSKTSRLITRRIFKSQVLDPNCPYRLMRATAFTSIFRSLPDDLVAPNVAIAGLAGLKHLRIFQVPVQDDGEPIGTAGLTSLKIVKVAFKSFLQTVKIRLKN